MTLLSVLLLVAAWPWCCLGFVLWLARYEEGLADSVQRATRTPDPPPVLAVPVERHEPVRQAPRTSDPVREAPVRAGLLEPSLGGSTNR